MGDYIEVEGLREFQRAVRKSTDREMPKRIGQAHKDVGRYVKRLVDSQARPEAVGAGSGATVRPSASKREVLLRVGGKHRADFAPMAQWGKKVVRPFRRAPARPYIRQIAERNRSRIEDRFLDAVADAVAPAFDDTEL